MVNKLLAGVLVGVPLVYSLLVSPGIAESRDVHTIHKYKASDGNTVYTTHVVRFPHLWDRGLMGWKGCGKGMELIVRDSAGKTLYKFYDDGTGEIGDQDGDHAEYRSGEKMVKMTRNSWGSVNTGTIFGEGINQDVTKKTDELNAIFQNYLNEGYELIRSDMDKNIKI